MKKKTSITKRGKVSTKKPTKRKTTVKTRNGNTWTEAMYFQKIRSCLRSGFRFWKPMMMALAKAERPSQSVNKRVKKEYQCSHCKNWFQRKMVQIHHIVECGSLNCWEDIVPFIQRLTCEDVDGYEVLCRECHKLHHKKIDL